MTNAFDCALRLLALRDHGKQELTDKLLRKGYSLEESLEAVLACQRQGLQSDVRFVEMLAIARIRQGYGPVRISQELREKQIAPELISHCIAAEAEPWETHLFNAWQKKFKAAHKADYAMLQKQQRFLLYRGFPAEMIATFFKQQLGKQVSFEQEDNNDY